MQPLALRHAARRPAPWGFTRVEFVGAMVLAAVLIALLLPAIQCRREQSRRTFCQNNLYQLSCAAIRHEEQHGFLPGWRNDGPAAGGVSSWPIVLLPYLERNDIFKAIAAGQPAPVFVTSFACPSSPPNGFMGPVLAYAGNCGSGSNLRRADGVMLDTTISAGMNPGRLRLEDIAGKDGTAQTLILAEKCGAGTAAAALVQAEWNDAIPVTSGTSIPGFSNGTRVHAVFGIVGNTPPLPWIINSPAAAAPGFFSQPSSNHGGGASVAICDGSTKFLSQMISPGVYAQLLSWDDTACRTHADLYATHDAWVSGKPAKNTEAGE